MADPVAPAGGFQQGGWYEGRQYWNGTFSAPGVINSQSNQVGAGQAVSSEVNRQSDAAQGLEAGTIDKYLAEQTQKYYADGGQPPTNPDQVTPSLNNYQAGLYGSGDIATRMAEMRNILTGGQEAPTPISRVNEFNNLRTQYGVAELEQNLADVNKQIADVQSLNEQRQYKAETGQVALGVIGGRQTEIQRQTNIQLDTLNRSKAVMVDELNNKYNVINQMVNYMGLDYQDAVTAYNTQYQQNLDMYKFIYQQDIDAQTAARANLAIYTNAITSGNMNYSSMSAEQKIGIQKLEIQSGLPVGFISSLQMSAKDRILGMSSDNTQAWIIGANGQLQVVNTGLKGTVSASGLTKVAEAEQKQELARWFASQSANSVEAQNDAKAMIAKGYNADLVYAALKQAFPNATTISTAVSSAQINQAKQLIISNGGSTSDLKQAETDPDFVNYIIATYGS